VSTVETVRQSFVQLWGALGPFWGVSPTTARIYGWLLSQSAGADAEEISHALELSRGAVSMACRELRDWGLVFPEKPVGARRVVYRPETDLEKVTRKVVQIRKRREWDPIRDHLHDWIPELEADPTPEAAVLLERLKAIEALVVLADSMAEAFLKGGPVGHFGLKLLVGAANSLPQAAERR
jgi:DNA-binding transcriptional regulator GbsR (MarR family)